MLFYREPTPPEELVMQHLTPTAEPALRSLLTAFASIAWDKAAISAAIKQAVSEFKVKMPQLAMPLRVLVVGQAQTPSVDAVLELTGREAVMRRMRRYLA